MTDRVILAGQQREAPDGTVWTVVRRYEARDLSICVQLRASGKPPLTALERDVLTWPVVASGSIIGRGF